MREPFPRAAGPLPRALPAPAPGSARLGLQAGDWGDLCEEDLQANYNALSRGGRLFSAYHSTNGTKYWIITECDQSATRVLMPEDY